MDYVVWGLHLKAVSKNWLSGLAEGRDHCWPWAKQFRWGDCSTASLEGFRGGGRRKRRQQLEREHTLLRKGNKIVFVLFAVRNDPMEKQRLMVQSEEKNDKVLGSVSLDTCEVFKGKRRGWLGITPPEKRAGQVYRTGHVNTQQGRKTEEMGAWGSYNCFGLFIGKMVTGWVKKTDNWGNTV